MWNFIDLRLVSFSSALNWTQLHDIFAKNACQKNLLETPKDTNIFTTLLNAAALQTQFAFGHNYLLSQKGKDRIENK